MNYYRRIVDKELLFRLSCTGAVLITGPKWCGKTTTGEVQAKSVLKMQDPDFRDGYLATANAKPSLLLKGEKPRLIDEWQEAPVLWDAVRTAVDNENKDGLFILTGSVNVDEAKIHHSGTGRISRLKMYPMSLYESKESTGEISLEELFKNPEKDIDGIESKLEIEDLIFAACRGGWPGSLFKSSKEGSLFVAKDYFVNLCENDISSVDGIKRNSNWTQAILQSYARNISTLAKTTNLLKDLKGKIENISVDTLTAYISALEKLYVLEDLEAWNPSIRSATAIRSGKKREFVDPSIAVAAMGLTCEYLEKDLKTFGFIFECLCIRDLKIYTTSLNGKMAYYRDRYGLEADGVLSLGDGRYALLEFKLGTKDIEEGAAHLLEIKKLIREYNQKEKQCPLREPDLMIVITGGKMAYTRNDGVKVIPIGTLKD